MLCTLSPIEPKCTGMCGAFAISEPSAANSAHEKSSRSLMLTEWAVCSSTMPISSATCMKRLLNTSSMIGSASRPQGFAPRAPADARQQQRAGRVNLGAPAGLDDRRGVGFDDQRGPREARAGGQRRAIVDGHVAPAVAPDVAARDRLRGGARRGRRLGRRARPAPRHHGLELERLDDERGSRRRRGSRSGVRAARGTRHASSALSAAACHATGSAVSAPATLSSRRRSSRHAPCVRALLAEGVERAGRERVEARRERSQLVASASGASTLACRSTRTSAMPIPNADSTPASGWMMTRRMPSTSATCAAC